MALAADGLPSAGVVRRAATTLRLSRRELLKTAGIARSCSSSSSSTAWSAARGSGHYDADALVIARTARELAAFGLEPRHLRAFRAAADREIGLVEQVVAPQRRGRDAAPGRAEETAASWRRCPSGCTRAGEGRAALRR